MNERTEVLLTSGDVKESLDQLERHNKLVAAYKESPREVLETEFRRIDGDFGLATSQQDDLQAITRVLVDKYNLTSADLAKLRGR